MPWARIKLCSRILSGFHPSSDGADAGGVDAGGVEAGGVDAGGVDAEGVDEGDVDAGGVVLPPHAARAKTIASARIMPRIFFILSAPF